MIAAVADVVTGMKFGTDLANEDIARFNELTTETFDSTSLGV